MDTAYQTYVAVATSQVERYSKRQLNTKPMPTQAAPTNNNSILSDFDRHRLTLLSGQEGEGWQAELHQYLKDMPTNVTKDTDVVEWWQVRSWPQLRRTQDYLFLTTYRIMDTITPPSAVSQSISSHAQLPLFLVSDCSLVVVRLQQSVVLS